MPDIKTAVDLRAQLMSAPFNFGSVVIVDADRLTIPHRCSDGRAGWRIISLHEARQIIETRQ